MNRLARALALALVLVPLAASSALAQVAKDDIIAEQRIKRDFGGYPVRIVAPADGNVPTFNAATGTWIAGTGGGGAGPTTSPWSVVLANGATSGGTSPVLSSGDKLVGAAGSDLTLNAPSGQAIALQVNGSTVASVAAGHVLNSSGSLAAPAYSFTAASGAGFSFASPPNTVTCSGILSEFAPYQNNSGAHLSFTGYDDTAIGSGGGGAGISFGGRTSDAPSYGTFAGMYASKDGNGADSAASVYLWNCDSSSTVTNRVRVTSAGSVVLNASGSAVATNAANGWTYVPTAAGALTGTPTSVTGAAAIGIDTSNNTFNFYSGGAWRSLSAAGGTPTWASVLGVGATSGGHNPVISSGDFLDFGGATSSDVRLSKSAPGRVALELGDGTGNGGNITLGTALFTGTGVSIDLWSGGSGVGALRADFTDGHGDAAATFYSTAAPGGVVGLNIGGSMGRTSGTHALSEVAGTFSDGGTNSSTVAQVLYVNPTINYTAGTKTGHYEALAVEAVETSLPTGTNLLLALRAGAAGTTDKLTVTNSGTLTQAGAAQHTWSTGGSPSASAPQILGPTDAGLFLTAGTASATGNAVTITGGTPGATSNGGAVALKGGAGGGTSGNGGNCSLTGGASTNGGNGGNSTLTGGAGQGAGLGGAVTCLGGTGGATGAGGSMTYRAGQGGATSGDGGGITLASGDAGGGGNGGSINISGGSAVGTDTNSGTITIQTASRGAGSSDIVLLTSISGTSGSTAHAQSNRDRITGKAKALTNNTATTFCNILLPTNNSAAGVTVLWTVIVQDAAGVEQTTRGQIQLSLNNKAGTVSAGTIQTIGTNATNLITGTDTITFGTSVASTTVSLQVTSNSSLTITSHVITYRVLIDGGDGVTSSPQ